MSAPSAVAGGWAVTYLDPAPSIQPSVTHTVGYWVLQHGTHPFSGDLGKTGLRFAAGADSREFVGVALGQPAHYAVTFVLPAGTYEVFGVQGMFQDHPLGTLTVPGAFQMKPPDPQLVMPGSTEPWPWQEIAPPLTKPAVAPAAAVSAPGSEPSPAPVWLVGLVVVAAAGLFVLLRKRLRPVPRR
ncbi:hypothetical protein ABZX92_22165 [Lentzea sp. NPDC006480]|uniref:hypothetical protein n=1 Tax=Lentzea sp. NPDC006480 TaxID=3157176 RepID=UPI00339F9ED6